MEFKQFESGQFILLILCLCIVPILTGMQIIIILIDKVILLIGLATAQVVSCLDPALTRREKGLVIRERCLGCAESVILKTCKPIRLKVL